MMTKHAIVEVSAVTDLNTFIGDGNFTATYFCATASAPQNMPPGLESEDRFFLTINRVGNDVYQKVTTRYGNHFYERTKTPGADWNAWRRIDNFGYNTLEELATALKPLLGLS